MHYGTLLPKIKFAVSPKNKYGQIYKTGQISLRQLSCLILLILLISFLMFSKNPEYFNFLKTF